MNPFELVVLSIGLSMDAVAAAVCKGLTSAAPTLRQCLTVGAYFGFFQAAMPLIGFCVGAALPASFTRLDHWIAFSLLAVIGAKAFLDAPKQQESPDASFRPRVLLPPALATSIDALSVGVSLSLLSIRSLPTVATIGAVTFALSSVAVKVGSLFGDRFRIVAARLGGVLLALIGLNILLGHLRAA